MSSCAVTHVEPHGFERVKLGVVEEILPRPLPACITDDELKELERRLWTLGLFDDVSVARVNDAIAITVREKWTLIPGIDVGSGKTFRDSYVFVSLIESNMAGRAMECGAYGAYYERALSAETWCGEHQNAARRVTFEGALQHVGSGFVFDDEPFAWERRRIGGRFGVRLPFFYGTQFRFAILPAVYHERSSGDVPENLVARGWFGGVGLRVTRDAYEWHDLAPRGTRLSFEATPGGFLGAADRHRHSVLVQLLTSFRLTERTGLITNLVGEAVTPGDPNHSVLLGSISAWRGSFGSIGGVRGLPDNRNRNAAHAFGNLELRHGIGLTKRLFLQPAVFVDGGVYARMNAAGDVQRAEPALSVGGGMRIVPTFLAWFVPRIDAGRLLLPEPAWFVQFAFSQYL
jgi:hypothetical protein